MGFLDKVVGRAKETAADVAEKAGPMVDKAKVVASDAAEKAAPVVDKAKDTATGAYGAADEKSGGRISGAVDKAGDVASSAVDKAKGAVGGGGETDRATMPPVRLRPRRALPPPRPTARAPATRRSRQDRSSVARRR